jgi:DNA phosphorothioation-dependent restriction protein DptG
MNDLRNVRDVLYSFSHCVKDEYQDLYVSIVGMIDSYIDKEELSSEQYTDDELGAMCDAAELEQTKKNYRAAIDEWNKLNQKYEDLVECHEELQDLFYKVDGELDELKVSYDQCQDNYHTVVKSLTKRDTFCSF